MSIIRALGFGYLISFIFLISLVLWGLYTLYNLTENEYIKGGIYFVSVVVGLSGVANVISLLLYKKPINLD